MKQQHRWTAGALALGVITGLIGPATAFAAVPATKGPVACQAGDVVQQVRTDHRRYRPAEPVTISVIVTNVSHHNCTMPSMVDVQVHPPKGPTLWQSAVNVDWIRGARWHHGRAITFAFTWDQQACSATPCSGTVAPGTYVAEGAWAPYAPATARFIINGRR
jgi:hypothetical protein